MCKGITHYLHWNSSLRRRDENARERKWLRAERSHGHGEDTAYQSMISLSLLIASRNSRKQRVPSEVTRASEQGFKRGREAKHVLERTRAEEIRRGEITRILSIPKRSGDVHFVPPPVQLFKS